MALKWPAQQLRRVRRRAEPVSDPVCCLFKFLSPRSLLMRQGCESHLIHEVTEGQSGEVSCLSSPGWIRSSSSGWHTRVCISWKALGAPPDFESVALGGTHAFAILTASQAPWMLAVGDPVGEPLL